MAKLVDATDLNKLSGSRGNALPDPVKVGEPLGTPKATPSQSGHVQSGRQDPAESIDFVNKGAADAFRIVVQNVGNAALARHSLFHCVAQAPARFKRFDH